MLMLMLHFIKWKQTLSPKLTFSLLFSHRKMNFNKEFLFTEKIISFLLCSERVILSTRDSSRGSAIWSNWYDRRSIFPWIYASNKYNWSAWSYRFSFNFRVDFDLVFFPICWFLIYLLDSGKTDKVLTIYQFLTTIHLCLKNYKKTALLWGKWNDGMKAD